MIFSKGFIYRWGQRIKDAGEQMAHVRLFSIPILRPFCGPVINMGNRIRDLVFDKPIEKRTPWKIKSNMKKDALFILANLDMLCTKHSNCKGCPVFGGCHEFIRLLAAMAMSIRTGDNLLRPAKCEKPI
jgi:hypothetical protein